MRNVPFGSVSSSLYRFLIRSKKRDAAGFVVLSWCCASLCCIRVPVSDASKRTSVFEIGYIAYGFFGNENKQQSKFRVFSATF